jgi:hypothetical protein
MRLYRAVKALLDESRARAAGGSLTLSLVDLPGKAHVELLSTVHADGRVTVLARAFPRHVAVDLAAGFAEGT